VIIYSQDAAAVGQMVDKRAEACYACHAADQPLERLSIPERTRVFDEGAVRNLGIINPIYNEPSCSEAACHAHDRDQKVLGVLDVTMSLEEVDQQMLASSKKILLLLVTAIAISGLIIWLLVQRLVGRPVSELVTATRRVAEGDLDYKLEVRSNDEVGRLSKSFNDMTQRLAEAQSQIQQSDRLASLGRMAAGIAHEINNPLTGVLTYSSFLLKRAPEGSETREDLETIVRETKRCREIVRGLLDFARQVPAVEGDVDLSALVERAVKIVQSQLSFDNVLISRTDAQGDLRFRGNDNQLLQVLINLLMNAGDAIGDGGGRINVETGTRAEGGRELIEIAVSDSGEGIAPEHLDQLFDPFFTTKVKRGTGLGLAVAWAIVDQHGGTIDVESGPGQGARFTVRIPRERAGGSLRREVGVQ
jgi:two-component system NtrC family sensor kinase